MLYFDHRSLSVPRLIIDADIAEIANTATSQWLDLYGNDKLGLNRALAEMVPDQAICFAQELCGEMHAGVVIRREGQVPKTIRFERVPMLSKGEALGEAMKMMDEYEGEQL